MVQAAPVLADLDSVPGVGDDPPVREYQGCPCHTVPDSR